MKSGTINSNGTLSHIFPYQYAQKPPIAKVSYRLWASAKHHLRSLVGDLVCSKDVHVLVPGICERFRMWQEGLCRCDLEDMICRCALQDTDKGRLSWMTQVSPISERESGESEPELGNIRKPLLLTEDGGRGH